MSLRLLMRRVLWLPVLALPWAGHRSHAQEMEASAWTPAPEAWVVFASADCEECQWMKDELLPELEARSGEELPPVAFIDIDDLHNYALLTECEQVLGRPPGTQFPAFLVGGTVLYGKDAIAAWGQGLTGTLPRRPLPEAIQRIIGRSHGVTFYDELFASAVPKAPGSEGPSPSPAPTPAQPRPIPSSEVLRHRDAEVLYFETTGCRKCARAEKQLALAMDRVAGVRVCRVDAMEREGRALQAAISDRLGVPSAKSLTTPMFASGSRAVFEDGITDAALSALLQDAPPQPFWRTWDEASALAAAQSRLRLMAAGFTLPTVIAAGLIDGFNPCAFAVIVFLVSYLTLTGKLGRRFALVYGLLFAAGVFVCYFLIGIGFFRLLRYLEVWQSAMRWVFAAMGVICLGFAIGGAADTVAAFRHGAGKMKFGMPKALHRVVHRLIREDVSRNALGVGAFLIGVLISGIELVCTGQIYLPVILFINSNAPGPRSIGLLTVYNLAFVLPLICVVFLSAAGLGSDALAKWAKRHAGVTRALTALLVLGLAGVMFYMALRG